MNKKKIISGVKFGIERETLRVDDNGRMAQTLHPFNNEHLSKDFCENQLEIITPVCNSIKEALNSLAELSAYAENKLNKMNEYLWLYSNPPYFKTNDDINVAKFEGIQSSKQDYRIKLERRYGKNIMLYSGIHFNISFPDEITGKDKNNFYLKLLKYSTKYSWLIVLLTAASPVYDKSFDGINKSGAVISEYASLRNSERGYWNQFVPVLDYSSIKNYCRSIQNYIEKGALFSASELYMPIRIKPKGINSLKELEEHGVDHIELRMFDLNPLSETGTSEENLEFAYYLMLYFSSLPDFDFTADMQKQAVKNHQNSARLNLSDVQIGKLNIITAAENMLDKLNDYFKNNEQVRKITDYQRNKLKKGNRCAEKIAEYYKEDYQNKMFKSMKERRIVNV